MEKFIKLLEARGLTESTIERYRQFARNFLDFAKGDFSEEKVREFLAGMRERGLGGTYQRFAFYVLKTLFEALGEEFPLKRRDLPKVDEPNRPYFTPEEMKKVIEVAKRSLRDYSILRLAGLLGCRRAEIHKLNRDDVDFKNKTIKIRTGKRGVPRVRLLDDDTLEALKRYLKSREDDCEALFVSGNRRVSIRELSHIVQRHAKLAGIYRSGIGFHSFRRGLATALHKRGMSIRELQELLGWKTLHMPSLYVQLEPLEVEEKAKKIHPLLE